MDKQPYTVIPRTWSLIFHQGKLLLIKFSEKKGKMEWWYNRIGGHIEQGEGILESAKREIFEETWLTLDVSLKWVVHFSNFFWKNGMYYLTISESSSDVVKDSDEGTLHRIDPKDLGNYKVFKDVKIVLEAIQKLEKWVVFTAKSTFNGEWELISFEME